MFTQLKQSQVNLLLSMKPTRLACLTTATLSILCIGLTVLSPHVTQVPTRRLAADWECPQCTFRNDGMECGMCGAPRPEPTEVDFLIDMCQDMKWGNKVDQDIAKRALAENDSDPANAINWLRAHFMSKASSEASDEQVAPVTEHEQPAPVTELQMLQSVIEVYDLCRQKEWGSRVSTDIVRRALEQNGLDVERTVASLNAQFLLEDAPKTRCCTPYMHEECPDCDGKGHIDGNKCSGPTGCDGLKTDQSDPMNKLQNIVFLDCGHNVCKDCLVHHITGKMDQGLFEILCPEPECKTEIKDYEIRPHMDRDAFNRRDEIRKNKAFDQMGLVECPKHCGWRFEPAIRNQARRVTCETEGCAFEFCSSCSKEWNHSKPCDNPKCIEGRIKTGWFGTWGSGATCGACDGNIKIDERTHDGKNCEEYTEALSTTDRQKAEEELRHEQDAELTRLELERMGTKPCSYCGLATIKNRGCNHMTCVSCRGSWCWTCGAELGRPYRPGHYAEEGPYGGCAQFDEHS